MNDMCYLVMTYLRQTLLIVGAVLEQTNFAGLAPVLVHMAKDSEGKYAFSPVSVNLLVEIVKTIFALGTLII